MSSLALNYLINLLARRDYSQYEIRCKMQQKAFTEQEIQQALEHCQQKNWQSDLRFAEHYIRYRAHKGFGANRIQQELRQLKGVNTEIIQQAMQQCEVDWQQLAQQVLHKKFARYADCKEPKIKQKIWRYMLSHGFYAEEFADEI